MNRIGDWGVLIGIFLIFTLTGSISFYDKSVDGAQVQSVFTWIVQNCRRQSLLRYPQYLPAD